MDERVITDEKRMWWEAYLASLQGLRARKGISTTRDGDDLVRSQAHLDADAALSAYRRRWGLEEVPNG
jgi:hypothetical protein